MWYVLSWTLSIIIIIIIIKYNIIKLILYEFLQSNTK